MADNPARQTASILVVAAVFVTGLIVLLVRPAGLFGREK